MTGQFEVQLVMRSSLQSDQHDLHYVLLTFMFLIYCLLCVCITLIKITYLVTKAYELQSIIHKPKNVKITNCLHRIFPP